MEVADSDAGALVHGYDEPHSVTIHHASALVFFNSELFFYNLFLFFWSRAKESLPGQAQGKSRHDNSGHVRTALEPWKHTRRADEMSVSRAPLGTKYHTLQTDTHDFSTNSGGITARQHLV